MDISGLNRQIARELRIYLSSRCITDGGLGLLGDYVQRLAAIQGEACPATSAWTVLVFAADHGVVQEGVSRFSPADSSRMLTGILCGKTAVGVLAGFHKIPLVCWDIGLINQVPVPTGQIYPLVSAKVASGTANFIFGPAMTEAECSAALKAGRSAVANIPPEVKLIALGEMGMGNTTAASALTAALLNKSPVEVVGLGAGNTDVRHKQAIVAKALEANANSLVQPLQVLTSLGGLEIAALVGACLESAARRKAVILDGFVTAVAALIAIKLEPRVEEYLFVSHLSPEPGHRLILSFLGLQPPMTLGLRIGEGAGALLLYPLLDQASALLQGIGSFSELGIGRK